MVNDSLPISDDQGQTPSNQDKISQLNELSFVLDEYFTIPVINYKFGLDPIISILPGVGDLSSTVLSIYICYESYRMGIPIPTILRILTNIGIDTIFGSIPLIGTVIDIWWKANKRNMELIESRLQSPKKAENDTKYLLRYVLPAIIFTIIIIMVIITTIIFMMSQTLMKYI